MLLLSMSAEFEKFRSLSSAKWVSDGDRARIVEMADRARIRAREEDLYNIHHGAIAPFERVSHRRLASSLATAKLQYSRRRDISRKWPDSLRWLKRKLPGRTGQPTDMKAARGSNELEEPAFDNRRMYFAVRFIRSVRHGHLD